MDGKSTAQGAKTPQIPREKWQSHENYPNQVLLLGSHENFRKVSAHLVDQAWAAWAQHPKEAPTKVLRDLFVRWKSAMSSHEGYEEGKLYPFLEKRFQTSMGKLVIDHRYLHKLDHDVRQAAKDGDALRFATALKEHHKALLQHLEQEENAVIPLLLSLTRKEFASFVS